MDPRRADGGDGDDDDELELELMDPYHPAMQRVQVALKRQLERQLQEVDDELRDKEKELQAIRTQRQESGVELYGVQQSLARMQQQVEEAQGRHEGLRGERTRREDALKGAREAQQAAEASLGTARGRARETKAEHDRLAGQVRLLEQQHDAVYSELLVKKRAATKTTRQQADLESAKQQQDVLVDSLHERIQELEGQTRVARAQKAAQETETREARQACREATAEVEVVRAERADIERQWQQSLAMLSKRSEALAALRAATSEQQQGVWTRDREHEGVKKQLDTERGGHETASQRIVRLEGDRSRVKARLESLVQQQEEAKRTYSVYTKSIQDTEGQLARASQETVILQTDLRTIREKVERLSRVKLELEARILLQMQDQITHDKAGRNVAKLVTDLRKAVIGEEANLSEIENDIGQNLVLAQDLQAVIDTTEAVLKELEAETADRDEAVTKFQTEAKRNAVAIERKQAKVDVLNRRIDTIQTRLRAEGGGHADISPAEIETQQLQEQITTARRENAALQRDWLTRQNRVIALETGCLDAVAKLDDTKVRMDVLQQRKFRLERDVAEGTREVDELRRAYTALHKDVTRLNILVNKKRGAHENLEAETVLMEEEFLNRLKADELECVQLQTQVMAVEEEKAQLLEGIVVAQEDILAWEKKLQLAREAKAQLNPTAGKSELTQMKAEIHRMEVRYSQLQRQKEKLIQQMELSVERRDHISIKARASRGGAKTAGGVQSQGALKREVADLKKRLKQTVRDIKQSEADIGELAETQAEAEAEIQETQHAVQALRLEEEEIVKQTEEQTALKARNLDRIVYNQRRAKHFTKVAEGDSKPRLQSEEAYETSITEQRNRLQSINNVVAYLLNENPELHGDLSPLQQSLNGFLDLAQGIHDGPGK